MEVTGKLGDGWGCGGWTTCEKWGIGNIRGLHKIRGLAPLCQICQEILKISHPPIIKPTSPFWLPPISNKSFPSLHYSHFWKIGGIAEPPPPLLIKGGGAATRFFARIGDKPEKGGWCRNYASENNCCVYAGFEVVHFVTVMLMVPSVATMHMTVSVAIMQLEVSATLMQVTLSAANMWVTVFIVIMQVGVAVAIMQMVFSAVHYAHHCFYCHNASDCFC